jgi:tRNA threonylcarbamoyladenosine biosynthesis protein TsaE
VSPTELSRSLPGKPATARLAADLARLLGAGDLLLLDGPLGAGKTFFTRALARALGLPPETRVTSPTFTLVHEHETKPLLVHADLYRLSDDERGVRELGLLEKRDEGALLVVEWGLPFERLLGGDALVLRLRREHGNGRFAAISATGPRSGQLLEALARIEVE